MRVSIIIFFLLCYSSANAQMDSIVSALNKIDYELAMEHIQQLPETHTTKKQIKQYVNTLQNGYRNKPLDTTNKATTVFSKIWFHLNSGNFLFYEKGNTLTSINEYQKAIEIATSVRHKGLLKECYRRVLDVIIYHTNLYNEDLYLRYLNPLKKLSTSTTDKHILTYYSFVIDMKINEKSKYFEPSYILNIKKIASETNSKSIEGRLYSYLLPYYLSYEKKPDSVISYAEKTIKTLQPPKNSIDIDRLQSASNNFAAFYIINDNPTKALQFLKKKTNNNKGHLFLYGESYRLFWLKEAKKALKSDSLVFYENDFLKIENQLNDHLSLAIIADRDSKYKTAEKEKQLLISEQENEKQEYLLLGLGSILLLGGCIAILLQRNTKRKQRIAEQQKELEIQKTEKLLKDQEITSINAMIEGQEKERQRLASDLHDSVGATLAAAKLQFNHIASNTDKLDQMQPLIDKTKTLLEDAYTEVRGMAHVKNSGVLAKNGLLPALKKLIKNVSATGTLDITLQDFGLDERIENTLEISIFRIIQELTTNIIKHANATQATIGITKHEDTLSIIVEDNGDGFTPSGTLNKDGMGLGSIERRIEHQGGSMEIDTTLGKGTTILIDIPI